MSKQNYMHGGRRSEEMERGGGGTTNTHTLTYREMSTLTFLFKIKKLHHVQVLVKLNWLIVAT